MKDREELNTGSGEDVQATNTRQAPGSDDNFFDIKALIRSVQRQEGNPDCFGTAKDYCDRKDCCWRTYCMKSYQESGGREDLR